MQQIYMGAKVRCQTAMPKLLEALRPETLSKETPTQVLFC